MIPLGNLFAGYSLEAKDSLFSYREKKSQGLYFPYNVIVVQSQIDYHIEKPGSDMYWEVLS